MLLLDDLPRKDKWWELFTAALRHPSVGMEDLADSLEESEYETHTESSVKVGWTTPLRKLPFRSVQILMRLDVDSYWKVLAAELDYTLEQVQRLETYMNREGSYVRKLLDDLAKNPDFNLRKLVTALQKIERNDVLEELSQIKEFRHLEWPDSIKSIEDRSRKHVRGPSVDEVTTIARPESCSGKSELCIQSRISNKGPLELTSCTNGSCVPSETERLVKSAPGVTLGNTQPMSMEETDDACSGNRHGQNDDHNVDYGNALIVRHGNEIRIPVTSQHFIKNENNSFSSESTRLFPNCTKTAEVPQNIEPHSDMLMDDGVVFKDGEIEISNDEAPESGFSLFIGAAVGVVALFASVIHRS
ncbi:uncharacterized protein LOC125657700 isoform X4 [Ostrea edulis]|nr:uncharacterized protein LOC125657700 isoform X4 [Ostrea edulis]